MKRIAILLAAAVFGSGCYVAPCDPMELAVSWQPVDVNNVVSYCNGGTLSTNVWYVDVYVDGVWYDQFNCDLGGVSYSSADVSSGSHEIMIEGRNTTTGPPIIRDWYTYNVDSCGTTAAVMYPAEAFIHLVPDACDQYNTDFGVSYLNYSLVDWTWSLAPRIESEVIGATTYPTCRSGVLTAVPLGYYELTGIEEVTSGGSFYNNGACDTTQFPVLAYNTGDWSVSMYASGTCPAPGTW
jgi:hypothetical protein